MAINPTHAGRINIAEEAQVNVSGEGAGRIVMEGGEVVIDDADLIAETLAAGDAGQIFMRVGSLHIRGDGRLSASSLVAGAGDAGDVVIEAEGTVRVSDDG